MSTEQLVPAYSIAKAFTALAALRTFEPGDRIGDLIDVPDRLGGLTIDALLAHRSGLDDYFAWPDYRAAVAAREPAWPIERVLERVELGEPGEFRYSNPGYALVRLALERAHGATLFEVLDRLVFAPDGVTAYRFETIADWDACMPSTIADVTAYDPGWVYPGTVVMSAKELERGLRTVLRSEFANLMTTEQPVDAPGHPLEEPGYGLGLMTSGRPTRLAGHGGGGPGFTLFALATVDGSQVHTDVVADGVDDRDLIRRCLNALEVDG